MDSHIKGELCEHCREVIAEEIGKNLFYLIAFVIHLILSWKTCSIWSRTKSILSGISCYLRLNCKMFDHKLFKAT